MDCRQYQEDLTAYMDGELTPSRASELQLHVQRCRPCAEELDGLKESAVFLESNAREIELDVRVWRNVKAQISTIEKPVRPDLLHMILGHRWATGALTAAAVVALAVGLWTYRERQADEQGLRQYMNEYVQAREVQEKQQNRDLYRGSDWKVDYPGHMDNPFVTVRPVSFDNPFRSEAR